MSKLARSNLTQRKTRTMLSVVAVAFELALVLIVVGLATGTLGEYADRIDNMESDIMLMPPGSQLFVAFNTQVMPVGPVTRALQKLPGIEASTPIAIATTTQFGGIGMVWGIDMESYNRIGRGIEILEGRSFEAADEMIVDTRLAKAKGLALGDRIPMLNSEFRIVGICKDGSGVRIYLPLFAVQDLLGRKDRASMFFIKTSSPDHVAMASGAIKKHPAFKKYSVIETREYRSLLGDSAPALNEFIAAVTGVAVFFGFLVISLSLYTTIIERTRQIGILKSLGASQLFIVRTVIEECLWLCLAGILGGLALTMAIRAILVAVHPTLTVLITTDWVIRASILAIVGGLLGALYPAWRAARVDPVKALQYE